MAQNLSQFSNPDFKRGRPALIELLWMLVQAGWYSSWLPGSFWRRGLLRLFGATIGKGVVIKPRGRVKFPWRLRVGNHSWIGEGVWIDNLAEVTIGANVCISQGAYFCTGSHDYKQDSFSLITKPIVIEDEAWIAAFAKIAPGVTVRRLAVVGLGAVLTHDAEEATIYGGNPAAAVRKRSQG